MAKIGEQFTFKAGLIDVRSHRPARWIRGFRAFNSDGKEVGIVRMLDDPRSPGYGTCELYFYRGYKEHIWHRFRTCGGKLSWQYLCNYLATHDEYTCYID